MPGFCGGQQATEEHPRICPIWTLKFSAAISDQFGSWSHGFGEAAAMSVS